MHYSSNTANLDVDRQRNRILATHAMKESLEIAVQGKTIISSTGDEGMGAGLGHRIVFADSAFSRYSMSAGLGHRVVKVKV